jgi:L-asparaginase
MPSREASDFLTGTLRDLFNDRGVEPDFVYPWGRGGIDSSDMSPSGWLQLTRGVVEGICSGASGALILHGTDTMAYSAAWLSLCLAGCPVPVVLTGSQFTRNYMPEDGTVNLKGAVQVICSNVRGVWVYFNWKLIQGNRAHKARASHPDAFTAMGGFPLFFNPEWGLANEPGIPAGSIGWSPGEELQLLMGMSGDQVDRVCGAIRWIFTAPGSPVCLHGGEEILGVVGYGAGNIPQRVKGAILEAYAGRGRKPIILACSQAEGDMKNPSQYAAVGMGSLAREGFTVMGQMDYPVEFVHALACYSLLLSSCGADPVKVMGRYLRSYS